MRSIVAGVSKTFSRSTLRLKKQATRKSVQLYTQAAGDGFIGFDQATEALAETVFVHFLQCFFVPQAAAVRGELIAQYHFTFVQAKLQLEVDQNQTSIIEQFFSTSFAL